MPYAFFGMPSFVSITFYMQNSVPLKRSGAGLCWVLWFRVWSVGFTINFVFTASGPEFGFSVGSGLSYNFIVGNPYKAISPKPLKPNLSFPWLWLSRMEIRVGGSLSSPKQAYNPTEKSFRSTVVFVGPLGFGHLWAQVKTYFAGR